jgi:hypothetical protein
LLPMLKDELFAFGVSGSKLFMNFELELLEFIYYRQIFSRIRKSESKKEAGCEVFHTLKTDFTAFAALLPLLPLLHASWKRKYDINYILILNIICVLLDVSIIYIIFPLQIVYVLSL